MIKGETFERVSPFPISVDTCMQLSEAKRRFAELMQLSQRRALTDAERRRLSEASQVIRYGRRRTAKHNTGKDWQGRPHAPADMFTRPRLWIKTGSQYLEVTDTEKDSWGGGLKYYAGSMWWHGSPSRLRMEYRLGDKGKQKRIGKLIEASHDEIQALKQKIKKNPARRYVITRVIQGRSAYFVVKRKGWSTAARDATKFDTAQAAYEVIAEYRLGDAFPEPAGTKLTRPQFPKSNPAGEVINFGPAVEVRYQRTVGRKPGFYKHTIETKANAYGISPGWYYVSERSILITSKLKRGK